MYKQEGYQKKFTILVIINLLLNINMLNTIFGIVFCFENGFGS
jgi:hypothetical protein